VTLSDYDMQFTFGGIWDVNPAVLRYMTKELLRAAHDFNMYDIESSTASAAEAQYGLAVMYINGMVDCERYNESLYSDCGVQTNAPEDADPVRHQFRSGIDEGLSWLRAAANLNHVRAQAIVHRVHKVFGRSLPVEDQFRVPGWLYLAVTKGYFTAAEDLFELSTEDLYDYGMITLRFQKSGVGKQLFDDDHFPSDTNPKFGIFTQSGREKFDRELKEKLEAVASVPAYCRSIFNHKGDTMLHYTATCGWQQTLSKLVASDPDSINTKNVNGEIPLLQACRSGHRDIVLFLLEHGADPKIASEDGNTPLHWLHRFETEDIEPIGRALVARGGNLDAVASGFSYTDCAENAWVQGTPLEWAILRNCLHAVEVLLGLGADVSPAISLAARLQYPEILNLLFSKPPTASRTVDRYGYSLLALAISGGSIQVPCGSLLGRIRRHGVLWRERAQQTIKLLLKQGDAIDLGDLPPHKGLTALLCGVLFAEVDVVAFLLQIGCDEHLNTLSPVPSDHEQYLTPLGCALHSRNFETFRLLLKHKADVTISHSNHPNLLYACAALNIDDRRYAQALIDAGLGIDDVPSGYETALGCAVRSRCFELADLLLERGADINNEYSEGLFFADAKPKTVLGYLVLEHSTNSIIICIDFLFNHPRAQPGFVVSRKTNFTVLHAAASIPQEEQDQRVTEIVLHRLMEYFKPTQAQLDMALNKDRYTALHLACLNFNTEAVRILLEFGADATLQNAYGEAPLDIARTSLITFPEFFSFRDEMKGKERQLTEGKARVEEIVSRLERSQEKSSGGRDCPKMEAS
jgi:ankyrin repeat protein